ncbi:MAG: AAA family ATPase [Actinobacteria bacterium]|nr:AAA family ATPase [Actinomycetota bacterium]MBU4403219.1 AAA family ATPase [Actinomycetota bacterium]
MDDLEHVPAWLTETRYGWRAGRKAYLFTTNIDDVAEVRFGKETCYLGLVEILCSKQSITALEGDAFAGVIIYRPGRGIVVVPGLEGTADLESSLFEAESGRQADGGNDDEDMRSILNSLRTEQRQARERTQSSPFGALLAITRVMGKMGNIALILPRVDLLVPANNGAIPGLDERRIVDLLSSLTADRDIRANDNYIFLIAESAASVCSEVLTPDVHRITVGWPDAEERSRFLEYLEEQYDEMPALEDGLTPEVLTRITAGISRKETYRICKDAVARETPLSYGIVRRAKQIIILAESDGLLEEYITSGGLDDVGGLRIQKKFYKKKIELFRGSTVRLMPTAILNQGVHGSGKTHIIGKLAGDLGIPCFRMKDLRSMWVGASEQNMTKVLDLIVSLRPVVLIMDEFEGIMANRTVTDNHPVDNRLLSKMLEFMSTVEERYAGEILLVAATNRPDLIDAAVLDRFKGGVIPFFAPDTGEIPDIMFAISRDNGWPLEDGIELTPLARSLASYTPRNLYFLLKQAAETAALKGREAISADDLASALDDNLPDMNLRVLKLETLLAVRYSTSKQFLPEGESLGFNLRGLAEDHDQLDDMIAELKMQERMSL